MDDAETLAVMMYGQAPEQEAQRRAMAEALSRNQGAQSLGSIGSLFSQLNPGLASFGESAAKDAAQRQIQLERAPQQGVNLQDGLMKLAETSRRNANMADQTSPAYQARAALLGRLGLKVQPGMNLNDFTSQDENLAERIQANENSAAWHRFGAEHRGPAPVGPTQAPPSDDPSLNAEADNLAAGNGFLLNGRSREALAHNRQVLKRALERHPDMDVAKATASYRASGHSLTEATKASDAMDRNEAKAEVDLSVLENTIGALGLTDNRLLNTPILKLKGISSPEVTAFQTARTAAISQVSRTLSANPNQVTEGIRHEAQELIGDNLTPTQFAAAFRVLRQDMARNKMVMHESVGNISNRMSSRPQPKPSEGGAAQQAPGKPPVRERMRQLKQSGATPDEIRKALKAEYTLAELKGGG